jgi:hypothetical protein
MPGLRAGHPRLELAMKEDVDGRIIGSGGEAVLRTSMRGHDEAVIGAARPMTDMANKP